MRPLALIFALVGIVHLLLMWRIGVPASEPPVPAMYWFFVALCWVFVNGAATVAIYAAYVLAFELEPPEFGAWLRRGLAILRAIAKGNDLPAKTKSSSSRG